MARCRPALQLVLLALACLSISEAARKINVQKQLQLARRSLSPDELARGRREDTMGLGEGEELKPGRGVKTSKGTTKVKFQETYNGLPIAGASVVFEEDDNGQITGEAAGTLVAGVDDDIPDVKPRLSSTDAFDLATRSNNDNPSAVTFDPAKDATLEVYLDDTLGETANARLIYKLSYRVEKQGHLSRPFFLVDANTGDIINQWEGLSLQKIRRRGSGTNRVHSNYDFQTVGGNLKIGKANYDGKSYPKLEITKNDNDTCSLVNNVARVYHCNNSWDCWEEAQVPYSFNCKEGLSDAVNGGYSPLADALFYISSTYEMFDLWYDVKDPLARPSEERSICGARIHYGETFENAFWDGQFITFGDGNSTFYPMTSINVVAHEIAHGITEMNSGLIYQGESGGINEAFSDMAGEAVEYYANSKSDWMIGYEIFKHPDQALRYFDEPEKDGRSIGDYNDYCPGLNVHYSSGVFNRAFYFLSRTEGWNVKKAFRPFVVANILYWMPASRMYEAACAVVTAANDLGYSGDDVTAAFRKVNIEPCVDTGAGVLSTAEINVPAGHEILVHINVTDDMDIDQMTIQTMGGRMAMDVKTPNCEFCTRKTYYMGKVEVCDIVPGLYEVSIIPQQEIVKGAIMVTGGTTNILSNGTLRSENDTLSFEFEFPEALVKKGGQVMFELTTTYGYPVAIFRHGEKPNLESFEFDFYATPREQSLVCSLKKGTYYGFLFNWHGVARNVDINIIGVLQGKRMDTPPKITRPPTQPTEAPPATTPTEAPSTKTPTPTEEGSASGSGSDTEGGDDDFTF